MRGALSLIGLQLRLSLARSAQYRWDFVTSGLMTLVWTAIGVIPVFVALHGRPSVAGWSYEAALVVVGWFTLLKGVLEGAVNPSLVAVVEHIRQGTLDFVLLKPRDAQLLVSTSRFEPWRIVDVVAGLALVVWALHALGRVPSPGGVALALTLLGAAVVVLYALWILVVSAAFWVVRLDNLAYLFNALFDFARWPIDVFRGLVALLFTYVLPLALMTTYPVRALLGTLEPRVAVAALAGALVFALVARRTFQAALARYTSASS